MLRRTTWTRCAPSKSLRTVLEEAVGANNSFLKKYDYCGQFVPRKTHAVPMVLMLGNHSAGKSTLINALLGFREQQTGVAPTDDGFTVLRRSDVDLDEDGPTAVTNPEYGFNELRAFGNHFVSRFKVKSRSLPDDVTGHAEQVPAGMLIVDTPGMIDTPVLHNHSRTSVEGQQRGYDFLGVTKWFAGRADVILLMFDPANPGTTGETLDVMQKSLVGQEHKFLILLNKVDMFDKVTDFARCYGTLCWNLSKNIQNKDIPRIYTTYTASPEVAVNPKPAAPLEELDKVRHEVIDELLRAPMRRLDNLITESEEATRRVHMSGVMFNSVSSKLRSHRIPRMVAGAVIVGCTPIGASMLLATFDPMLISFMGLVGAVGVAFALRNMQQQIELAELRIIDELDNLFATAFRGEDSIDVQQRWEAIKPYVRQHLKANGASKAPSTPNRDLKKMMAFANDEVPRLRKMVMEYKERKLRKK